MPKLTPEEQEIQTSKFSLKYSRASSDISNRNLLYTIRRNYYDGKVFPQVERGHNLVYTQYAKVIVDKFASYTFGNNVTIKLKPDDVSAPEQLIACEKANKIVDKMYNNNKNFQGELFSMGQTSGLYGDGYLTTEVKDGVPIHRSINQPENVLLGFTDTNYSDLDFWILEYGLSKDAIKDIYGIEVDSYGTAIQDVASNSTISSHSNPYAENMTLDAVRNSIITQGQVTNDMALYGVLHDFINDKRVQAFNREARFMDDYPVNIYHFKADSDPGRPYGLSDFESVAQIITQIEEKLSEESDAVSMSVHHKILTNLNPNQIKEKFKPNQTQAIKVNANGSNPDKFEILNTSVNTYSSQQLISVLMNVLRTSSGLQELGQDQIAANVSGRAIAYMFQGVQQKVAAKRIQLDNILTQIVIDDFRILAEKDANIKKLCFDESGTFIFDVKIKYPPVLEQEEQVRISNIATMRQTDLISKYSARMLLSEYIDDPMEEEKRINQEKEEENKMAMDMEKQKAEMQAAAQPQASAPTSGAPRGPEQPSAVTVPEMGPQGEAAPGVVSTQGNAGSAQNQISAAGLQNQITQQTTQ